MTDIDLDAFAKESSINNEDYWFLKLNQMDEKKESSLSGETSDESNKPNEQ
ncbi:MAG: hypothetical protein IIU83_06895 [Fibrobacteraceae bacterium]|nr:hypothetical protein [Fibrobacteraceae bacterium]